MKTKRKVSQPPVQKARTQGRKVKIDFEIVAAHKKLQQELKKLGVETGEPGYNLEPPLGRDRARFENQHNH